MKSKMFIERNAHRNVHSHGGKSGPTIATVLSSQSKVHLSPVVVALLRQQHKDRTGMKQHLPRMLLQTGAACDMTQAFLSPL